MSGSSPENAGPGRPSHYLVVFALWMLVFGSSSQTMIMSPILPQIRADVGITESLLGTLISVYSLMLGLFAVISGPVSDRIGRRRILLLGAGVMTLGLGLHALVVDYVSFLVVRAFTGIAGGILSGAAVSYVGDYFPYERRGWAIGWVMSGSAAGQIVGIPAGILLAGEWGFRTPFYLFGLIMALTLLLIWLRLPHPTSRRSSTPLGVRRAAGQYWRLLRTRGVAAGAAAYFLIFLGIGLYVVYLPTWLEDALGAGSGHIATLFLVAGVANVLAGPQAGTLSDRIGRKVVIIVACAGLAVTMMATTLVVRDLWAAYPLFFVVMVLVAARMSPFSALLTALVEDERRGSLMSLSVALGHVGLALGGGVAGMVYAGVGYGGSTVLAALSVLAMAGVVGALIPEPEGEVAEAGEPAPEAPAG